MGSTIGMGSTMGLGSTMGMGTTMDMGTTMGMGTTIGMYFIKLPTHYGNVQRGVAKSAPKGLYRGSYRRFEYCTYFGTKGWNIYASQSKLVIFSSYYQRLCVV